ncbi:MAG: PhoU domain-containing protein [Candidatus Sedimenticola sp. (ex Thyasira tokunagai)]
MTMQLPKGIRDNLHFLCVEVDSQVANLQTYFETPTVALARRILDRSGYAYNLKMRIHTSCLNKLSRCKEGGAETLTLRGVEFIATDLERIAELSRDCIKQMDYLINARCPESEAYGPMLERVRRGIKLLGPAILENDTRLALKIGQIESKLDRDYNRLLKHYIAALKQKKNTEDLTSALFVAHSVEQMGDALLDISESIISANLGQPVNFERYHSLQASVEDLETDEDMSDVQIERIAETRSGSAISGISAPDSGNDEYVAIFKEGKKRKLKEERQGVESWHEIYPGLAPKILSYKKRGQSASLLIEHLPGFTFEQILLNESPELLSETLDQLGGTLRSVWHETQTDKPVSANFIQQLEKRLSDVYKIHPEFQRGDSQVCGLGIPSFDSLVKRARDYEARLQSPFSVYIHGDFNVDNIIYDPMEQRINFIDLHRSCYMDYVQDISVFMVSNYRLQILDAPLRQRIMNLAKDFYRIARDYADKVGDETFELRLALGLARSFVTSTRFILDKTLARSMFLRSRYLLEQALAINPKKAGSFKTPVKEIFIG